MHPLGRPITAEDCAEAAVYLCSDRAANVTGVLLPRRRGLRPATMSDTQQILDLDRVRELFDLAGSYLVWTGGKLQRRPLPHLARVA